MRNGTRDTTSTPSNTVSAVKKLATKDSKPNTNDKKTIIGRKTNDYSFKGCIQERAFAGSKIRKLNGEH